VMEDVQLVSLESDHRIIVGNKGVRGLVQIKNFKIILRFENLEIDLGSSKIPNEVYLDCLCLDKQLWVLDVLYFDTTLFFLPYSQRMEFVPRDMKALPFFLLSEYEPNKNHDIFIKRESAPYDVQSSRVFREETGCFLVKNLEMLMGLPACFPFHVDFDLAPYEGKVIEVYLESLEFFRERPDRMGSDSSISVAQSLADYRVKYEDLCAVIKTVEGDEPRDVLKPESYNIFSETEYGKMVRLNKQLPYKLPLHEEDDIRNAVGDQDYGEDAYYSEYETQSDDIEDGLVYREKQEEEKNSLEAGVDSLVVSHSNITDDSGELILDKKKEFKPLSKKKKTKVALSIRANEDSDPDEIIIRTRKVPEPVESGIEADNWIGVDFTVDTKSLAVSSGAGAATKRRLQSSYPTVDIHEDSNVRVNPREGNFIKPKMKKKLCSEAL